MSDATLQERYWRYLTANGPKLHRLRSPGPTKALIVTYFLMVALAIVCQLAMLLWPPAIWLFLACIVISMIAWTTLRSTIDVRDAAPRSELDDFEAEVLAVWRKRALNVLLALLFLGAATFVIVPAVFSGRLDPVAVGTAAGVFMLYSAGVVSTLPAVGYALTFNRNADEED